MPHQKSRQKPRPNKSRPKSSTRRQGQLPASTPPLEITIDHIGHRGDGIGAAEFTHLGITKTYKIFVPDSAAGDVLKVQPIAINSHGIQATITQIITPSADRAANNTPSCNVAAECGGCQFQHLNRPSYQTWKDAMVQDTLSRSGVTPREWRPSYTAPDNTRRRARFAFRCLASTVVMGFRARSSHKIIPIDGCIILAPQLIAAYNMAREVLLMVLTAGQTGEIDINLCSNNEDQNNAEDGGWDVTIRPDGDISYAETTDLITAASQTAITRLSFLDGKAKGGGKTALLYQKAQPFINWPLPIGATRKSITLHPAPSTFLQAEAGAEMMIKTDIFNALLGRAQIVDLFAGSGTLSLPLLFQKTPPKTLAAYDSIDAAIQSMIVVAKATGQTGRLHAKTRNLAETPLDTDELNDFDGAIIDPPRGGGGSQIPALAASRIPRIMMVSCNPQSFAKDAAALINGGYHCTWARHIDQFLLTSHAEVVACFDKTVDAPSIFEGSMFT